MWCGVVWCVLVLVSVGIMMGSSGGVMVKNSAFEEPVAQMRVGVAPSLAAPPYHSTPPPYHSTPPDRQTVRPGGLFRLRKTHNLITFALYFSCFGLEVTHVQILLVKLGSLNTSSITTTQLSKTLFSYLLT